VHIARRIATEHGARIHAITVLPILPTPWAGTDASLEAIDDLTGERERTARERLSSTADGVTRDAACAVLAVPRGVRAAAEPSMARAGAEA
jgi:hypothetical protein